MSSVVLDDRYVRIAYVLLSTRLQRLQYASILLMFASPTTTPPLSMPLHSDSKVHQLPHATEPHISSRRDVPLSLVTPRHTTAEASTA